MSLLRTKVIDEGKFLPRRLRRSYRLGQYAYLSRLRYEAVIQPLYTNSQLDLPGGRPSVAPMKTSLV